MSGRQRATSMRCVWCWGGVKTGRLHAVPVSRLLRCPKTIDGDLKNVFVPVSFGFDTACKTYSELIGMAVPRRCWSAAVALSCTGMELN